MLCYGVPRKSGRYPFKTDGKMQRMIGMFTIECKKIHDESPEHDTGIKRLIQAFGYMYDGNDHPSEIKGMPLKDAIEKKVFES